VSRGSGRSGFLPDRTVHLHPIGRCNLACLHCYASSSPRDADVLPIEPLERALAALRAEGYEVLSLSGGEPLLYPDLARLARAGRALGYRLVAISNGFRVRPAFDEAVSSLDGIAISFDGMGEVHNRVRGHARAFDVAVAALEHLGAIGVPAAAAYTVSSESLPDIPDFVEMAFRLGARAVQLRPLVLAGRAVEEYADGALGPAAMMRLYLIGSALAEAYAGDMAVHTDVAHSRTIAAGRPAYGALLGRRAGAPLADLVNPLVVRADGRVKPLTFDFPDAFDLGRLEDVTAGRLAERAEPAVGALGRLVGAALDAASECDRFLDWFAFCRDLARSQGAAGPPGGVAAATAP
jgi:MoaA/NifB/PqqE/SkfB family radical SAM enzyme